MSAADRERLRALIEIQAAREPSAAELLELERLLDELDDEQSE